MVPTGRAHDRVVEKKEELCITSTRPLLHLLKSSFLVSTTPAHENMQKMSSRSKRARFRAWFFGLFRRHSVTDVHDFVVNNPTFYNVQVAPDQVAAAIKELSERAIDGAAYDSSARDPPPSCHPGTRVRLLEEIRAWFDNTSREKAFLWLSGPAGVGKSAVIQTFAESLAESQSLGATLFFSRLNDRKDPQRVMATVSFQLAMEIPAYRAYVTGKITHDPSLLKKGMKEQFQVFIVEPFGIGGIGEGQGPWGILLDGLDECEGVDQQCEIIRLVSEFVLKFPDAPLVWTISSRPEPHIVATFASSAVVPSHRSEYIPINSTEGCKDVERYLNKGFENMRNRFPHVPSKWPKETEFLKLAHGALGLFVFARTAVRFMEDPKHADPVSRLNLLLSVIDHLDVVVTDEHPFALLDALYKHLLNSIPPTLWFTTKRILGFFMCSRPHDNRTHDELSYPLTSHSLMAASIILNIEQHVVYSSLHQLHSVLEIPNPDVPHTSGVTFFHASFGDYLTNPIRSNKFFVGRGESVDEITRGLLRIYMEAPWDNEWAHYTSQLSIKMPGRFFYQQLQQDTTTCLFHATTGDLRTGRGRGPFTSGNDRIECLTTLCRTGVIATLYWSDKGHLFTEWLFKLWNSFPEELRDRGMFKEISLLGVRLDHLKTEEYVRVVYSGSWPGAGQVPASVTVPDFEAHFRTLQRQCPGEAALICGNTTQNRNAFIRHNRILDNHISRECFYCIPYPY